MRRALLVLCTVATACSPGQTTATTTTSTTPISTTTSSPQVSTTALVPTSTTSTVAATTTSEAVTTTTTGLLDGNWADEPLVTTEFGALGWWDGSGWLDAESEGALPVVGGEDYQTVLLGEVAKTTGGPETTLCPPLELIGVELTDPDRLGSFPGPYGVAISAPWPLQPHLFEEEPDDGSYRDFAAQHLSSRGLEVANPIIKQLFRTDLEGDGINEVLAVAEDVTTGFVMRPGDYSIAFMRHVVDGEVRTAVIGETVVVDETQQFGGAYSIGGVADLNGDGKMEIITNAAYFEGFSVSVWEDIDDEAGPVVVLERGCGS